MNGYVTITNYQKDITEQGDILNRMGSLFKNPHLTTFMNHHNLMALSEDAELQSITYSYQKQEFHIVFNGKIYNAIALKNKLIGMGYTFHTTDDTEILLLSYIVWHEQCLDLLDGVFSFVIDDGKQLFIARDQLGVKPLFYYYCDHQLITATQIKCILAYLGKATVDQEGIKQLLGLGPSLIPGKTIYKDIFSLRPGHYMIFKEQPLIKRYWNLTDREHSDNLIQTVRKVRELVTESIQQQLESHIPMITMLSGGLDSSIIMAVAKQYNCEIESYSVHYEDQQKYFKAYHYQTTMDDDYIQKILQMYPMMHHEVVLKQIDLIDNLENALIARDMPGMADIDASFHLFSQAIGKTNRICLSGECADEIFGGYPWFYQKELYDLPYFPWMRDLDQKLALFNDDIQSLHLKDYIISNYQQTLSEIPTNNKKKQLIYLNMEWFMQTLLTRADSQATMAEIEVRVPFASKKIFEYMYNLPESFMFFNNEEKGILRKAFEHLLPPEIAHRKKNPYPKTHSPIYTELIYQKLKQSLDDPNNILFTFFDQIRLTQLIETRGESIKAPWFGQLMTGPQLLAYLYQIYRWANIYQISIEW